MCSKVLNISNTVFEICQRNKAIKQAFKYSEFDVNIHLDSFFSLIINHYQMIYYQAEKCKNVYMKL